MADERFEIYTRLMGGKDNLPPRLPTPPPSLHPTNGSGEQTSADANDKNASQDRIVDAFGNLQTYDDFVTAHPFPAPQAPAYDNRHAVKTQQPGPTKRKTSEADETNFTLDPSKDEPSEIGMSFCPFIAFTKFPYKYVDPAFKQPIATAFFDGGKIYNRSWDFYYAWCDEAGKAIAFIPLSQAQALIEEVNKTFADLRWKFESHHEEEGLLLTFEDPNPDHRPRFLGSADSRDKYDFFLSVVEPSDPPTMHPTGDYSLAAFKGKIAQAAEANKNKTKQKKREKHQQHILNRQTMGKQLLQGQKYFGLIPSEPQALSPDNTTPQTIDVDKPAAYPCEVDAVIISIDIEAYEKAQGIITEVGVSTLDTRDLQGTAPGKNGENWQKFVRARHFRVLEHKSYENKDFVAGCADKFQFGTSEWVSIKTLPSVLTQCFHEPFSKPSSDQASIPEDPNTKRNIVLLGHDIEQDIQYCHKIGFSVLGRGNLIATMDTKAMYQAYTRDTSPRGLGGVMNDFGITAWYLHNAGNDAVYTFWAMLATCVQDAAERGTEASKKKYEERSKDKLESAIEAVKERAKEDAEGWDVSEGGGVPLPQPPSASGHYTLGGAPLDL